MEISITMIAAIANVFTILINGLLVYFTRRNSAKIHHEESLHYRAHEQIRTKCSKMMKAAQLLNRRIAMLIRENDHNYLNKALSLEEYDYFPVTMVYIMIDYLQVIFEFNDTISVEDISHLDAQDQAFINYLKLFKMALFSSFIVKDLDSSYDIQHEAGHFRNFEFAEIIHMMNQAKDFHDFRVKIFVDKDAEFKQVLAPVFKYLSKITFDEKNAKAKVLQALLIFNIAFITTFSFSSMKYQRTIIEGMIDAPST